MKGKVFIDTNVLIYSISTDAAKASKVGHLMRQPLDFIVSTQVISEFINTCHRKNLLAVPDIRRAVEDFLLFFDLVLIEESTISAAFDLKEQHSFSWYDALIVAAALENNCSTLFSEDMQHGMTINGNLTIENPFLI